MYKNRLQQFFECFQDPSQLIVGSFGRETLRKVIIVLPRIPKIFKQHRFSLHLMNGDVCTCARFLFRKEFTAIELLSNILLVFCCPQMTAASPGRFFCFISSLIGPKFSHVQLGIQLFLSYFQKNLVLFA